MTTTTLPLDGIEWVEVSYVIDSHAIVRVMTCDGEALEFEVGEFQTVRFVAPGPDA